MSAVWRESVSTGRARLVLLAIADMQGEIGAWPSIATLANMVNSSERSVQRDIKELQELGELIVFERQAPTRAIHKSNLYWVNLPSVAHKFADTHEVTNSDHEVTNGVHEVTNSDHEVTPVGVITITRTINNPLKNNYTDEQFIQFWNIYPKKIEKADALRVFRKAVNEVGFDTVMAGALRLANDPNRPEVRFIPNPAKWLRNGGWDDEPYSATKSAREVAQNNARDSFLKFGNVDNAIKEIGWVE
jgi:DNA-binding Lrp family transcriptional regulator